MTVELSIDDKIRGLTPEQLQPQEPKEAEPKEEPKEVAAVDKEKPAEHEEAPKETEAVSNKDKEQPYGELDKADKTAKEETSNEAAETDEYGLEVPKARTYTEEEVQRMIRDRLSRGHQAQQHNPVQQQTIEQARQDFQVDPNSDDSWEVQLAQFVDSRLDANFDRALAAHEQKKQNQEWQRKETEIQANFEAKFSTGMEKHKDFIDVVGKLPITDSMMLSIRDMDNPATFLYAASKLQPDEIKRIASIADPFQQAKALGQLDERMKKARKTTRANAPLKTQSSDVSEKYIPTRSIDDKIQADAKAKRRA